MRLLFDHKLSPKLVHRLADLFPDANHLFPLRLEDKPDTAVWEFAKINGFTIVSKDADFSERSVLYSHPPKIIHLHLGNCSTVAVEQLLREHARLIADFDQDESKSCLHLPPHFRL